MLCLVRAVLELNVDIAIECLFELSLDGPVIHGDTATMINVDKYVSMHSLARLRGFLCSCMNIHAKNRVNSIIRIDL